MAFVQYLRDHPDEIPKCKDSDYAKKTFAREYFYLEGQQQDDQTHPLRPIPKETVFKVYEYDPKSERDKLVTLVLPKPEDYINDVKPKDVWLCTWANWATHR